MIGNPVINFEPQGSFCLGGGHASKTGKNLGATFLLYTLWEVKVTRMIKSRGGNSYE